jgi:8-oxo-dGTP diphosphatase
MGGPPRTPLLTVDVVIELDGGVVLIERAHEPRGWALPGGFVDIGETVEAAAAREAMEETSLAIALRERLGVYSEPTRDLRGHTVSVAFVATAEGRPLGADDARRAEVFPLTALPTPLCFDHALILQDYAFFVRHGRAPNLTERAR